MTVDMWVGVAMFGAAMFGLGLLAGWSLLIGPGWRFWHETKDEAEVPWYPSSTPYLPIVPEPAPKRRKRAK